MVWLRAQSDSSDSSDSSDEDNEDSKLSRKNKPKKAKTKKQADGSSSDDDKDDDEAVEVGRDGILCTATKEELAIAKELAADPWGRCAQCPASIRPALKS